LEAFYKKITDTRDDSTSAWDVYADFQTMDTKPFVFDTMVCTALFRTFAKLNHECNSSTYISYGNEGFAQIKVHASRDIAIGQCISNSYLHTTGLSKTQRRRALCQYLFECTCELCENEDSDDEDDDE
jgi:hypothetical protein